MTHAKQAIKAAIAVMVTAGIRRKSRIDMSSSAFNTLPAPIIKYKNM